MSETLPALVEPTPLLLIQQALEAKIPASELKGFFDLQVRAEERRAEGEYAEAITAFQAECPVILNTKDVKTKGGGVAYRYAPFESIMAVITPYLRKHRIVISFDTAEGDGKMQTTCRVRVGVVEKHTTVVLPIPAANAMTNATQSGVGAISYGKRIALTAALNLVCADEDHSGQDVGDPFITQAEIDELDKAVEAFELATGKTLSFVRFLAAFGGPECKVASQLRRSQWQNGINDLRSKIAKGGAK